MINDQSPCACGHIWDEHIPDTQECQVKDCPCFYFEEQPAEEEPTPSLECER